MADNTILPTGSGGDTIATDDIAGVKFQRVKLIHGADGVNAGDVSTANPLPITSTGNVAAGATDSGNPVKVGGLVDTGYTNGPYTTGQRANISVTEYGEVRAAVAAAYTAADAQTNIITTMRNSDGANRILGTAPYIFNGTTWDRLRGTIADGLAVNTAPDKNATFKGRVTTFRTPGRAGTAGQKIFALHNATGSTKVVKINQLAVDLAVTVVKAVTVLPPLIRICRFTALPTNGTALTKVAKDTALSSNASVTAWGDASADGTGSATTLTITIPAGTTLTQEFAPRLITAVGYEPFDRAVYLEGQEITLRALEGIVVFLDYVLATQNPVTDMWAVTCDWYEI